jgi:hypothetical protein
MCTEKIVWCPVSMSMGKHLGIGVDVDKICVFCGKCCVCIDKCVFTVVKIKCVNSGRISDIFYKVNFTTKLYTFYNTWTNI